MRLVVDTNIWVSFLIGKKIVRLKDALTSPSVTLLFSDELLNELASTLQRPYFQKYFTQAQIRELIVLLDSIGERIPVTSSVHVCRDPNDDFLLALCKDGKADYLLTGDNDLLSLHSFEKTVIVDSKTFDQLL